VARHAEPDHVGSPGPCQHAQPHLHRPPKTSINWGSTDHTFTRRARTSGGNSSMMSWGESEELYFPTYFLSRS
jgi:hypothetical protein